QQLVWRAHASCAGVSPTRTFLALRQDSGVGSVHERLFRRDAEASTRDACATRISAARRRTVRGLLLIADLTNRANKFAEILPVARGVIECVQALIHRCFWQRDTT